MITIAPKVNLESCIRKPKRFKAEFPTALRHQSRKLRQDVFENKKNCSSNLYSDFLSASFILTGFWRTSKTSVMIISDFRDHLIISTQKVSVVFFQSFEIRLQLP